MELPTVGPDTSRTSPYLTERQRGTRAAVLGAALGVLLALLGRRR